MKLVQTVLGEFWVYDKDLIGRHIAEGKFWDEHLKPYFDEYAEGASVVEVGANIGFHTVYLAEMAKNVFAFEPLTTQMLHRNLTHHGAPPNVVVYGKALYSRRTDMRAANVADQLTNYDESQNLDVVDLDAVDSVGSIALVPADLWGLYTGRTGDSLLEDVAVDFIKLDAQGCDLPALQGMVKLIAANRPVIIFEFEAKLAKLHGHTWKDYEGWFKETGYRVKHINAMDFEALPE